MEIVGNIYRNVSFTSEPGYYEDGAFGIRIENVVLVKKVETKYTFGGKNYLTMEPVTMVYMYSTMSCDTYVYMHTI